MSYSNAIFHVDLDNGSNVARAVLSGCTISNTTGTTTSVYYSGHGLTTGAVVDTTLFEAWVNGEWKITKTDDDNFTLDGAVWVTGTTGTTGNVAPRGGASWNDAFLTLYGPSAAKIKGGDEIRVSKTPDPISIGNATWTKMSGTVTIDSSLTKSLNVSAGNTWTVSTNVTRTSSGTRKYGSNSEQLNIASAFTTGKVAYIGLTGGGTQDFSGYQIVNFWIRSNAILGSGYFELWLCSDATGDVPVHQIPINNFPVANAFQTAVWDNGGALSATIQSISLQVLVDPGTVQITINDIFASNDLTLSSNIGISNEKDFLEWYPIQAIYGSSLLLDTNNTDNTPTTYKFATQTVETFIRRVKRVGPYSASSTYFTFVEGGSNRALISYVGGWNTSTNERDGLTCICNINGTNAYCFYINTMNYISIENFGISAFARGIYPNNTCYSLVFKNIFVNSSANGITISTSASRDILIDKVYFINNTAAAITLNSNGFVTIKRCKFISLNNTALTTIAYGIDGGNNAAYTDVAISDCDFIGTYASFRCSVTNALLKNCKFEDNNEFSYQKDTIIRTINHGKVWGNNRYFHYGASGYQKVSPHLDYPSAWQFRFGGSAGYDNPFIMKLGEFLVEGGTELVINVPVRKSVTTSFCRIFIYAEDMLGIDDDIEAIKADDIDWETLQISVTPPVTMVVPVYFECYFTGTITADIWVAGINTQIQNLVPTDIKDLMYWWEADTEVYNSTGGTISHGQTVATWKDLSGNGYDLTGTTGPTWNMSGGTNNMPVMEFNGVDQFLNTIPHIRTDNADLTLFVLLKWGDSSRDVSEDVVSRWTSTFREFTYQGLNTAGAYEQRFYTTHNNSINSYMRCGVNKFDYFLLMGVTANECANRSYFFTKEYINTNLYDSTTTTQFPHVKIVPSPVPISTFVARQNDTNPAYSQLSICSIILFNREISTWERAMIYKFYRDKWGSESYINP